MLLPGRTKSSDGELGATAVEYAILASLIAAVIVAAAFTLGSLLPPGFQAVIEGLS